MRKRDLCENSIYPPSYIASMAQHEEGCPVALIASIDPGSPAYDAGFESGCIVTTLDGKPLLDLLDWQWRSDAAEITVGYRDNDGDEGEITLYRDGDEPWGFVFEDVIFDDVRECKNACSFCFIRQLPDGMRPSLQMRDDDYRLSFLSGTFVTLTNLTDSDVDRIIEQRISPLHVSLQAIEPEVRKGLMGKHAHRGLEVLNRLLNAGVTCYCQIVLVPGVNDGEHLKRTLEWAYAQAGILGIGVVPLGYTKHQHQFMAGFDRPFQAQEVLELLKPYQQQALQERGNAWVYPADEFYLTAYGKQVFNLLPLDEFYGDYDLFEDGIGMVRTTLDEWKQASDNGLIEASGRALERSNSSAYLISGFAQQAYLTVLMRDFRLHGRLNPLYVQNDYFGGNVNVTGLLTGQDIVRTLCAIQEQLPVGNNFVLLPRVIFNDDGVTLDDMTLEDIAAQTELPLVMVSCSTLEYLQEIIELVGILS